MKTFTFLLLLISLSAIGNAQPVIVNDLQPGVFSSDPTRLTVFNGRLFFMAGDNDNGVELRMYDGLKVQLVKDVHPGTPDCTPIVYNRSMAELDGKLYFPADDGVKGLELYSVDKNADVKLESDINGGQNPSDIDEIISYQGKLYFDATNGADGRELWHYDPVKDHAAIVAYVHAGVGSDPDDITECNGKIYFSAYRPDVGRELFEYDPATQSHKLVTDIYVGDTSSMPMSIMAHKNTLYFSALSADYGRELYSYDGNTLQRITDLAAGKADGVSGKPGVGRLIGAIGDDIYFAGSNGNNGFQLYKYAGGNTSLVSNINASGSSYPAGFTWYANKIYFYADDGMNGREVWQYDLVNPPSMLANISTNQINTPDPAGLIVYNNKLYFTAYGDKGNELYSYTAPTASIAPLKELIHVNVYPNPTNDFLQFSFSLSSDELIAIHLSDVTGRVVYITEYSNYHAGTQKVALDISHLAAGSYQYHLLYDKGRRSSAGLFLKQ